MHADQQPAIIDAVLPAAGRIDSIFAAEAGVRTKALIELGGRTLLERVIAVLRATGRVGRIVVIGTDEVVSSPAAKEADAVLPEAGPTGPDNILAGMQWLHDAHGRHSSRVLVLTTDLPFITPEAVSGFLEACPADLDICLPLIRRGEFEARFPGLGTQYVRLRDGEWTMGCAFLLNPEAITRNRRHIDRVFAARKSQLAMARLLGIRFVLRFLIGRLTMPHIEHRCLRLLGCSGLGIRHAAPELAMDIDRIEDYRYAVRNS